MTIRRKQLGRRGEEVAARHLEEKGYRILNRNYCCRIGEIDLIVRDGDMLVFVEVRSRSSNNYGSAQESITARKQMKLRQLAWQYLKAQARTGENCRFDVIAVLFDCDGKVKRLEHIENAF